MSPESGGFSPAEGYNLSSNMMPGVPNDEMLEESSPFMGFEPTVAGAETMSEPFYGAPVNPSYPQYEQYGNPQVQGQSMGVPQSMMPAQMPMMGQAPMMPAQMPMMGQAPMMPAQMPMMGQAPMMPAQMPMMGQAPMGYQPYPVQNKKDCGCGGPKALPYRAQPSYHHPSTLPSYPQGGSYGHIPAYPGPYGYEPIQPYSAQFGYDQQSQFHPFSPQETTDYGSQYENYEGVNDDQRDESDESY